MDNWVSKVGHCSDTVVTNIYSYCAQMGFPVLTVTETPTGIKVRQDRFLEHGPAKPEDNETIWQAVFISLITTTLTAITSPQVYSTGFGHCIGTRTGTDQHRCHTRDARSGVQARHDQAFQGQRRYERCLCVISFR